MLKNMNENQESFLTIMVSIIIAAIIVRIIYVWCELIIVLIEEIVDEDNRHEYARTHVNIISGVVVTLICIFLWIIVYKFWKWIHTPNYNSK